MSKACVYDVCIIGSGPAALSALSALHEPYSALNAAEFDRRLRRTRKLGQSKNARSRLNICVVSPSAPAWLPEWEDRFAAMEIKYLRSPAAAHPDMFSAESLLNFARLHDRMNEVIDVGASSSKEFYGGRISDLDSGLFNIPSQSLFMDFCRESISNLPHTFIQGSAVDINHECLNDDPLTCNILRVFLSGNEDSCKQVLCRNVIVATGSPGPQSIPQVVSSNISATNFTHTSSTAKLNQVITTSAASHRVLVVGGGLSAVQAAIAVSKRGAKVVLASRRPLQWRHFDLPINWFDPQMRNQSRFEFLCQEPEARPEFIRSTRGGGSVPPWYRRALDESSVELYVGEISACVEQATSDTPLLISLTSAKGTVCTLSFHHLILATGHTPNFQSLPLGSVLQNKWPRKIIGGLPLLETNLKWTAETPIYLTGSVTALQSGPDAANLMGARRCAKIIA
ncbi:unnamed protein product, partial [Ectocarpus fasciculatus]